MSKRRRRSRAGSGKHKARPTATAVAHFTAVEEEFFRTGDSLHELPAASFEEAEPERPSLWRRLFSRAA
jgi:hypothetical protein